MVRVEGVVLKDGPHRGRQVEARAQPRGEAVLFYYDLYKGGGWDGRCELMSLLHSWLGNWLVVGVGGAWVGGF